jgi:hypothetical protein
MKYKLTLTTHQFMLCDMCIKNSYDFLRHIKLSASNLPDLDNKKEIIKLLYELKPIVEEKGWAYTIQDREFMYTHLIHQDAINHIAYCEFTEDELYQVSRCVEDWHLFVAGQVELDNTTCVCKDRHDLHDNMRYLHDVVMDDDYYDLYDTYGWNGNHCKNYEQRKFICETYPLYRDILVYFTRRKNTNEWSVYNSDTLRCELSGTPIKIEEI